MNNETPKYQTASLVANLEIAVEKEPSIIAVAGCDEVDAVSNLSLAPGCGVRLVCAFLEWPSTRWRLWLPAELTGSLPASGCVRVCTCVCAALEQQCVDSGLRGPYSSMISVKGFG